MLPPAVRTPALGEHGSCNSLHGTMGRAKGVETPVHECQQPAKIGRGTQRHTAAAVQLPGLEVWFQRASDVVRKLVRGDLDLGIVGADMFQVQRNSTATVMIDQNLQISSLVHWRTMFIT